MCVCNSGTVNCHPIYCLQSSPNLCLYSIVFVCAPTPPVYCYTFPPCAQVDRLVEFELSHVNTLHPDFIGADGALAAVERMGPLQLFRAHAYGSSVSGGYVHPPVAVLPPYEPALEDYVDGHGAGGYGDDEEGDIDTYDEVLLQGGTAAGGGGGRRGGASAGLWGSSIYNSEEASAGADDEDDDPVSSSSATGNRGAAVHAAAGGGRRGNSSSGSGPTAAGAVPTDIAWALRNVRDGAAARRRPTAVAAGASRPASAPVRREGVSRQEQQQRRTAAGPPPPGPQQYARNGSDSSASNAPPMPTASHHSVHVTAFNGSNNNSSSSGSNNKFVADIEERFAPHIVDLIAGYSPGDPLPDGVLRVGGPHSPFVAKQRQMMSGGAVPTQPSMQLGGTNSGGSVASAGSSGSPVQHRSSSSGGISSPLPMRGRGAGGGGPYPSASDPGVRLTGGGGGFAGGSVYEAPSVGADARRYVHLQLATMQSRPLPSVITPQDLRATPKEALEIRAIRLLVLSYLSIVRKTYEVSVVCRHA